MQGATRASPNPSVSNRVLAELEHGVRLKSKEDGR